MRITLQNYGMYSSGVGLHIETDLEILLLSKEGLYRGGFYSAWAMEEAEGLRLTDHRITDDNKNIH